MTSCKFNINHVFPLEMDQSRQTSAGPSRDSFYIFPPFCRSSSEKNRRFSTARASVCVPRTLSDLRCIIVFFRSIFADTGRNERPAEISGNSEWTFFPCCSRSFRPLWFGLFLPHFRRFYLSSAETRARLLLQSSSLGSRCEGTHLLFGPENNFWN